ncbi:MAG: hypothetical protein QCH31_06705 [Methanolobus sp.]|nr:hypothetical protein [Methanolobus sp.]
MKRTTSILLAGMLIASLAGIGIVNGAVVKQDDATFFGQMHKWTVNRIGYSNGYGYASCPVYGAYASEGVNVIEPAVATIDEAIDIAADATGQDIIGSDVYQMGRWWVFSYTDDAGILKQGRIDAYTGDVIVDLYAVSAYRGQYYNSGRGMMRDSGYGGCGGIYRY